MDGDTRYSTVTVWPHPADNAVLPLASFKVCQGPSAFGAGEHTTLMRSIFTLPSILVLGTEGSKRSQIAAYRFEKVS